MAFNAPVDIVNRAMQHLGASRPTTLADTNKGADEAEFLYDKCRRAELERNIWAFSTRRAALRYVTSTTKMLTFGAYAAGTTYGVGDIVMSNDISGNSVAWVSIQATNLAHLPATVTNNVWWQQYFGPITADTYDAAATYSVGELILNSGTYYKSIANANIAGGTSSPNVAFGTAPTAWTLYTPYPVTLTQNGASRNQFVLPYGFLRVAQQDPKGAGAPYSGTTAGLQFSDFQIEDIFLLTSATEANLTTAAGAAARTPLIFRFAADVTDVTRFSTMFCEGLAARIAMELCETMTQKPDLYKQVMAKYDRFMAEARRVNEIEVGSTEPDETTFRTSRMPDQSGAAPQGR